MKSAHLCLLFSLVCASVINAQVKSDTSSERMVEEIVQQWKEGYNNGHAAKVADLYTPDAYYLTQHFVTGIIHGRAAIQAYVQRGVDAHYHIDSIRTIRMERLGDFAYAITRFHSTNGNQRISG